MEVADGFSATVVATVEDDVLDAGDDTVIGINDSGCWSYILSPEQKKKRYHLEFEGITCHGLERRD